MNYKGYSAAVEFDPEDEIFVGHIAGINDVVGFHASSVKALKVAFREAVDDYLELCRTTGKKPDKAMSGNLMLRVDPVVHSNAAVAAELAGMSLNQWAEEALRQAAARKAVKGERRSNRKVTA